ncbi:MAG: HNH endonuclease [Dehalococcoidales bacterium]|nr:HNH endonuclease [Dehalococcoidales bacterium]
MGVDGKLTNLPVLVLNQSYEPLNICRVRRAVVLIQGGKAELLENGVGYLHSALDLFSIPSVIRLSVMIKRPRAERRMTRFEIFNRDHYTCQYCGKKTHQLTLDHVMPRHRKGEHTWENVVSACIACNRHKAGRTPEEANMKLARKPTRPHNTGIFNVPYQLRNKTEWQKYLLQ